MNDLNLRVAALKLCAHPKRFAEMRGALAPIPVKWQDSQVDYVLQFGAAKTCTEQMSIVKTAFEQPQSFSFLADVIFGSPLKHPVRGVLVRLFSNNEIAIKNQRESHTKDKLLAALRESLRDLASSIEANPGSVDFINDIFVSVGGCLHNFPYGRDALAQEIKCFIPLLPKTLWHYWAFISDPTEETSPTRCNEYYLFVQNLLRFHVNFLVEYQVSLVPEECQELRKIDKFAECVARHVDTPWDVRSIAGLAIGHNARFFNELDQYLSKCKDLENFEDLPIKAAALLVLQKSDYATLVSEALDLLKHILDQVKAAGNITNLLVYMSKHLHTYAKSLSAIRLQGRAEVMFNLILAILLRFSMEHISSNVESIRHMSANILLQVVQHAKAVGQINIINQVYTQFEHHRMPFYAVCLMLQQLVEVMGPKSVLQNCPSILQKIFPTYLGLDDSVNALYKCMMSVGRKDDSFKNWFNVWCVTLLRAAQPNDERLPAIERLIKVAVQLDTEVLAEVLKYRNLPLSIKLAAMFTARRHGQHALVQSLLVGHIEQIKAAIVGVDDNNRLLALSFVVETPRLSETYTQFELDAILSYLQHNANNPNAHMRQIGRGLLQKACKRLELNLAQQLKDKKVKKNSQSDDGILFSFLDTLLTNLALNLFPTANYGRRWLSMHLLHDLVDMLQRLGISWRQRLPPQTIPFLDHCLRDSYEHNKALAAKLLIKLHTRSSHKPAQMMQLLKSLRPPDSATAAYQLQVYCQVAEVETPLPPLELLPYYQARHYAVLQWCMEQLHSGIAQAQSDLTLAAKSNPLYGLLFASRHVLQQLQLKELAKELVWRQYVEELLRLCQSISDLMLPMVGSDSPEGHLPAPKEPESEAEPELDTLSTTPQLVLLCAWRSIKEISLILGELVQHAPLQQEQQEQQPDQYYLLSQQQVADIGEHFLVLLAEIKHRGAFEQAYVGFSLLCRRFWHSDEPALNQLPPVWLDEAMQLISGDGARELCPTRRSAGMPYMLQALICTELKLGTHNTFSKSMCLLLKVCERRESGPAAAIARSHALNIMRALFRCSELAELVGEFIERGVMCALDSLVAVEWAERNCATLLLSALMVRIFGVERARNEMGQLHVRNRMTGRIFFTRYPKLFDYFHTGLQNAAEKSNDKKVSGQTVQLEAMLQLLSRLYPSALEGTESTLNLSEFIPFLETICCVHDNMTRQRASQVLSNLSSVSKALKRVEKICVLVKMENSMFEKNGTWKTDLNGMHGHLLQLLELYSLVRWQDKVLICIVVHTLSIAALNIHKQDIYIFNAILNVLIAIMQDAEDATYFDQLLLTGLNEINQLNNESIYNSCAEYAISPKFYELFTLHLCRISSPQAGTMVQHMLRTFVEPEELPQPLEQLIIELWLYVLCQQANTTRKTRGLIDCFELKNYQFDRDVVQYYKSMSPHLQETLAYQLRESVEVQQHVMVLASRVVQDPCHCPGMASRVYALLALLHKLNLTVPQLLERSASHDVEPGLVLCLTRHVMECDIQQQLEQQKMWLPLLRYTLDISSPTQKPYLRYKAAQLVDRLTVHVQYILSSNDVELVGNYIRLVLQLLVDECELVRNCTAEMVSSCMSLYLSGNEQLSVPTMVSMLPMAAERYFLQHMLHSLKRNAANGSFLIGIFSLIVEPFVSPELLEGRDSDMDEQLADEDVFDKHETNLYCEGLRVASQVAKSFRATFPTNNELISALDALEKMCSYSGYGDQAITPRIIS